MLKYMLSLVSCCLIMTACGDTKGPAQSFNKGSRASAQKTVTGEAPDQSDSPVQQISEEDNIQSGSFDEASDIVSYANALGTQMLDATINIQNRNRYIGAATRYANFDGNGGQAWVFDLFTCEKDRCAKSVCASPCAQAQPCAAPCERPACASCGVRFNETPCGVRINESPCGVKSACASPCNVQSACASPCAKSACETSACGQESLTVVPAGRLVVTDQACSECSPHRFTAKYLNNCEQNGCGDVTKNAQVVSVASGLAVNVLNAMISQSGIFDDDLGARYNDPYRIAQIDVIPNAVAGVSYTYTLAKESVVSVNGCGVKTTCGQNVKKHTVTQLCAGTTPCNAKYRWNMEVLR